MTGPRAITFVMLLQRLIEGSNGEYVVTDAQIEVQIIAVGTVDPDPGEPTNPEPMVPSPALAGNPAAAAPSATSAEGAQTLPVTGTRDVGLALLGACLVTMGLAFTTFARRIERTS